MKRFKQKIKAIQHILRGGQYAVFVIDKDYINPKTTPNKTAYLISDNASDFFLKSISEFIKYYRLNIIQKSLERSYNNE